MKDYNVLRGYMTMANISQKELAECINLSHVALSKRLTGKIEFTKSDMLAIQNVLNSRLGTQLGIEELFFS